MLPGLPWPDCVYSFLGFVVLLLCLCWFFNSFLISESGLLTLSGCFPTDVQHLFVIQQIFSTCQILQSHLFVSIVDPIILGGSSTPQLRTARQLVTVNTGKKTSTKIRRPSFAFCHLSVTWRLEKAGETQAAQQNSKQATLLDSPPTFTVCPADIVLEQHNRGPQLCSVIQRLF